MSSGPVDRKACDDLDWPRIVSAVTERCAGPMERAEDLPVATTVDGARQALGEAGEAWALLSAGEPLPLEGLREIRPALDRLERGGVLDGPSLRDIASVLSAARTLRRFLTRQKQAAPELRRVCGTDPNLDTLAEEITGTIEPDGRVADEASPDLRQLRTEASNLRGRLIARLEALIHKRRDILQDNYYTIREGRYVLPVRTDAHERLPGIVHGTSASGATVFVEPRPLVTQGNRLKMATAEMEREEHRLLSELSERVREQAAEVRAAADALDHADLRAASAKLARDLRGTLPTLADSPRIRLPRARHPVLVLDGGDVVANDLELEGGHALVVSGPNAGGKTVALKCLGLAALMTRAGLPYPCDEGAECGFFELVLTDVGDQQSITSSLSSFSAQVSNLVGILRRSSERSLVLLDELAGSTDPQEGAALACAIVDALCNAGAAVAVTTHYEPLKAMGARDARLRNASVGFDVQKMEPTFALTLDVPGSSSALAVASRFGMPESIVDTAREMLPEQARDFEALVHELAQHQRRLEQGEAELRMERARAERAREQADERERRLRDQNRRELEGEAQKLFDAVRRARQDVEGARKRVRQQSADDGVVRHARDTVDAAVRALDEAQQHVGGAGATPSADAEPPSVPETDQSDGSPLRPGEAVWVPRLRSRGEVLDTTDKGKVRVGAGALKLWIDVGEVQRVTSTRDDAERAGIEDKAASEQGQGAAGVNRGTASEERDELPPATADNTLDVRGMRVDDALSLTESFVDRLYGDGRPVAYIVHGIGSGALRDAIRDRMRAEETCVERARSGSPEEGGDKITVVHLR